MVHRRTYLLVADGLIFLVTVLHCLSALGLQRTCTCPLAEVGVGWLSLAILLLLLVGLLLLLVFLFDVLGALGFTSLVSVSPESNL